MSTKKKDQKNQPNIVEAAGGILWKETSSGLKLAIIYRKRYDDWSLPKGKREPAERWEETAMREVWEETGCQPILGKFIGSTSYIINHNTPKIVLFWHMYAKDGCDFQSNHEVDRIKWVKPQKALNRLKYKNERDILTKALKQL